MFSKACEYGMRAVIYVARQSEKGKKVGVKAIAQAIKSPEAFTGKVMQKLTKSGIIQSTKGPYGGFFMDKTKVKTVKLSDIIKVFDGKNAYSGCVLGLSNCSGEQPCPVHFEAEPIINDFTKFVETKTVYDTLYVENKPKKFWLKT
ncbi:MAG: transcriptional regulator [Draconibacterium sp.]|nr:MAG: transcriptional regulator [Draconibacterium sp.]